MIIEQIRLRDGDTWSSLLDLVYPIGSYYISNESTSPAELFGGTWTQLDGYFLRAANDIVTGGSNTVSLSEANLPAHAHWMQHSHYMQHNHRIAENGWNVAKYNSTGGTITRIDAPVSGYYNAYLGANGGVGMLWDTQYTREYTDNSQEWTGNTGSGTAFSNMPQYRDAYVWIRNA